MRETKYGKLKSKKKFKKIKFTKNLLQWRKAISSIKV